jgi:hypothetical protein
VSYGRSMVRGLAHQSTRRMKTFGIIIAIVVGLGIVLLTLAAIPREVFGSVYVNLSSCLIHIETQAGSPDTYFKTFVCEPTYGSSNEDCYFVILFGNGSCDEVYHYSKPASIPVTPTQ